MTGYNEYKDSGISWIGDIPAHWKTEKGKHILTLLERAVRDDDEIITCFRDGEVTLRKNRREEGFTVSLKEIGYQGIEPGDLVVHGMDGFAGSIGVSDSRGKATPVLNVMDSDQNKRYLMYYLRTAAYKDVFMSISTGIRVRFCDLRWNKISVFPFILPERDEQDRIVRYIDEKIEHIDILISEARASIEEYKAWKASVIFEAVTKGLDPNVEMKDSGIEWIGMIPNDWKIMKLKYFISGYKAGPFGSALITDALKSNGNILVYTPEHIAKKAVELDSNLFLPDERRDEMQQFLVEPGDIIFPIVGSLGRSMLITKEMPTGIINQRLAKFKLNQDMISMDYFLWLFSRSTFYNTFIELNCRGSIIVNLTKQIVSDMPVPLPSNKDEQERISEYLSEKCEEIDSLIFEKESLISDLESYKKSLIFEVVTGKRRVC